MISGLALDIDEAKREFDGLLEPDRLSRGIHGGYIGHAHRSFSRSNGSIALLHFVKDLCFGYSLDMVIIFLICLVLKYFPGFVTLNEPTNKLTGIYRVHRSLQRLAVNSGGIFPASNNILMPQNLRPAHSG